jgi:hypothetical protein
MSCTPQPLALPSAEVLAEGERNLINAQTKKEVEDAQGQSYSFNQLSCQFLS